MALRIVTSRIIEDAPQADGRRWITELHIDDEGGEHQQSYLAAAETDAEAQIAADAAVIEQQLNEPKMRTLPVLEFRDRFSSAEKAAIYTLAAQTTETGLTLRIWLDDLNTANVEGQAGIVDLDNPRLVGGINALPAMLPGVFTPERVAELLA